MASPVFVVGCPRSGTSLLNCVLFSAGRFAIYRTESHTLTVVSPRFADLRTPADREAFLEMWTGGELYRKSGLPESAARDVVLGARNAADFLRRLMEAVCEAQGATHWADSTPEHGLYLDRLKEAMPDAKVIHVVRDGRDVAASLVKQGWIRPLPWEPERKLEAAAMFWAWLTKKTRENGRRLGDDYMEVRFDQLVGEREETYARIGEFVGAPVDVGRVDRAAIGSVGSPNSSFASGGGA